MARQRQPAFVFIAIATLVFMLACTKARQRDDHSARLLRIENTLQSPVQILDREMYTRLSDRMAQLKVPGLSAAVFEKGKVVWAKAWGVLEAGSPRQADTHTIFQAASIGKPMTATLAMKAVDRGWIGLDQPVNELLQEWKVPENDFTRRQPVTLRLLLTHQAGILVGSFTGFREGEPIPSLVQILNGEPPAKNPPIVVDILPGAEARYSDFNYAVIQQLLIERGGAPFGEMMQREVLDPSGMIDSGFEQPLSPPRRLNAATGHRRNGEPIPGKYRIHPDLSPSGLWSTPTDICRWAMAVLDAWQGRSERLVTRALAKRMLEEGFLSAKKLDNGGLRFDHTGSNIGFTSVFCAYTKDYGAAIMSNSGHFDIINELLRAIAVEYDWEDKDTKPMVVKVAALEDLGIYAGSYKIGDATITVSADWDHLVAVSSEEGTLTLYPRSATDFIILEQGLPITIESDDSGKVIRARNSNGLPIERIGAK